MSAPPRNTARTPDGIAEAGLRKADALLVGDGVAQDPAAAAALYRDLAGSGSGQASARLAVLAAMGIFAAPDWAAALDHLADAAERGHRGAQKQLAVLADRDDLATRTVGGSHWRRLREGLDLAALLAPPPVKTVSMAPAVMTIEALASRSMCKWIIAAGRNRLQRGMINDFATGQSVPDPIRTAFGAPFGILDTDLVVILLQERLARATRLMVRQQEAPFLLSYEPGQQYLPHHDYLDPSVAAFAPHLAVMGQRVATCLVYLNDDYEGGETDFPMMGWRYRGRPGDALVFLNVTPDRRPDPLTLHAGLQVTRGHKWLLSQWVRDRVQPIQ